MEDALKGEMRVKEDYRVGKDGGIDFRRWKKGRKMDLEGEKKMEDSFRGERKGGRRF